jgi:hypothetical protein
MVSRTTMNIVNGILIFCLAVVLTIGALVLIGEHNQEQTSNVGQADIANTNTSSASETASSNGIFQYCTGSFQTSPSEKNSLVVFLLHITNTGEKTYSTNPDDWYLEVNGKTYSNYLSSDFKNSENNTISGSVAKNIRISM